MQSAGIDVGQRFGRSLLLDLYRKGEVFTHGTGPGQAVPGADDRQLEFDFSDDPEPETSIPACSQCNSLEDLHLVTIIAGGNTTIATILCPDCRVKNTLDISVPLPLVDRTLLTKLMRMKGIPEGDDALDKYRQLLNRDFQAKWDQVREQKSVRQEELGLVDNDGLGL